MNIHNYQRISITIKEYQLKEVSMFVIEDFDFDS